MLGGPERTAAITAAGLRLALDGEDPPFILDVRTPREYAGGHIPQAHLLPLDQLESGLAGLPRDRAIVCVCRSGHRSEAATRFLRAHGLRARNLSGGMLAWHGTVTQGPDPGVER